MSVWDFWAQFYERLWVQKVSLGPTRRGVIAKMAGRLSASSRVLDVGCGIGELLGELAHVVGVRGTEVPLEAETGPGGLWLGVDASPGMIERAKRRHPELAFEVRDASSLKGLVEGQGRSRGFDALLCTHSLPYYAQPELVLEDMASVLAPEGVLVLAQASTNSMYDAVVLSMVKMTTGKASYYSVEALRDMAARWFEVESVEKIRTAWFMPSIVLMVLKLRHRDVAGFEEMQGVSGLAPVQDEIQDEILGGHLYENIEGHPSRPLKVMLLRVMPDPETIGLQHVMVCEPLELEYLASNLGVEGHEILVVDMILEKQPLEGFLETFQPDAVLMSGYITHVGILKRTAAQIKKWRESCLVGVGGVHAEVVPEDFESVDFDRVFTTNAVQEARRWLRLGGESEPGAKAEAVVAQPLVPYELLPPDRRSTARYREKYYYMFHNPCALIKTSYGCPFDCNFCFCREITGGKYSVRTMDSVIEELKTIQEEEVYIVDDDFLVSEARVLEFCDAVDAAGLKKKYLIYGRADFVAKYEPVIERFSRSGLRAVIIGLESARVGDLENYGKQTSLAENEAAARILRRHGIELYGTMIMGMDFTKADFKALGKWLREHHIHFVNLQPLTPLPGTGLFDLYKDQLLVPREDYAKWDLAHLVLKPEKLSVRVFYWEMVKLYYKRVASPAHAVKLIRRYGLWPVLKLTVGSSRVTWQYLKKILQG